jgi:hypothetical protein
MMAKLESCQSLSVFLVVWTTASGIYVILSGFLVTDESEQAAPAFILS